jgi:hypothetical protein
VTTNGGSGVDLVMRLALLLPIALIVAACGSSAAVPPKTPAPKARAGPPPAWLETKAGSRWLGFSSYCWNRGGEEVMTCADAVAPKCSQRSVPKLSVEKGETVRAHLGYVASKAAVDDTRAKVDGRTVSWRIERGGPFVLFAKGPRRNDASYVGCGVLP